MKQILKNVTTISPKIIFVTLVFALSSILPSFVVQNADAHQKNHKHISIRNDLGYHFKDAGTNGTMVIQSSKDRNLTIVNTKRANQGYLPGSTFKILNSLILLQEGVVDGPDSIIPGPRDPIIVDGKSFLPDVCQESITFVNAFKNSCANAYQQLTRKLDVRTYKKYINKLQYGNRNITSVPLDEFWLEGDLKITPEQQVEFLKKLHDNKLPFSQSVMNTVKTMMLNEQTPDYTIRGKSGWVYSLHPNVGWWIGWVETGKDTTYFALNLDINEASQAKYRMVIANDILRQLGYLPAKIQ